MQYIDRTLFACLPPDVQPTRIDNIRTHFILCAAYNSQGIASTCKRRYTYMHIRKFRLNTTQWSLT